MDALLIQPEIIYPNEPIAGRHQDVRRKEGYIEIGLLSVASFLESKGVDVEILDLVNGETALDDLEKAVATKRPRLAAIPCMSGYAYPSLRSYSALIKDISRDTFIITGGQHSGPLGPTILEDIPQVDCAVQNEGEFLTWEVFNAVANGVGDLESIPGIVFRSDSGVVLNEGVGPRLPLDDLPFLNYTLFPGFSKFVPRLEESRGCPFDCWFCSNASVFSHKVRYKTPERLINELCEIHKQYGKPETLGFYLIAKNYGLNEEVTLEFAKRVSQLPFLAEWRTQSSVDVFNPEILPFLSKCGLRMLDLGLESASPKMLLLMNKTSLDPEMYLRKAEEIIKKAAQCSETRIKINLIFYPGETAETLAETLDFLFRWRSKISGVTATPVMVDPGAPLWHKLKYFEENYGTRLIKNEFWDSLHIYPAHPSSELSFEQANVIATLVSKMFQTKEDYFTARKFGGLRRGTDIIEFDKHMEDVPGFLRPYSDR
jgi:anaerobic magnesium-protoporphyrin IX monomethyl ester cyclase